MNAFAARDDDEETIILPPPTELATRALLKNAQELLEAGQLATAIPYLEESIVRYSRLEGKDAEAARAEGTYQLSLCYLETEQFAKATALFQTFVESYPEHGSTMIARVLTLESLARQNDAVRMTEYIDLLESRGDFDQLEAALKDPANADTCRNALITLMQAYAQSADLDNYKRFLPFCDEDVLSDMGLNLSLMDGGDLAVEQGRFLDALQWYRFIQTAPELIISFDRQLAVLQAEFAAPLPWVPLKKRERQQAQRAAEEQRYENLVAVRDSLAEKSYDLDLMLRMGQCYDEMERWWIAISVFQHIYTEFPESRVAERSHYFSFSSLLRLGAFAAALDEGAAYTNLYPQGRFRDEVTLSLMHAQLGLEDLGATDQLGRSLLEQAPVHRYADQINYLLGYVQFQREAYEAAIPFFQKTATNWPNRLYAEESTYWVGMCTLFLGEFERTIELFEHYLNESPWSPKEFGEDVTYRLGMAYYGLEDDEKSKAIFSGFLEQFPDSILVSEACSMLGDLVGAEGNLDLALDYYAKGRESAINSTQFDYAVFQAATACELLGRHEGLIELMTDYLQPSEREGRYAEAGVWLSKAWSASGNKGKALDACCETLVRYGNDPHAKGFAPLIGEILSAVNDPAQGAQLLVRAKNTLGPFREKAVRADGSKTLGLYLTVLFSQWSEGDAQTAYQDSLLAETSFEAFAPLHLLYFSEVAAERRELPRVRQAYDYFVETFHASEQALDMANIGIVALIEEADYTRAFDLTQTMLDLYPGELAAALTQKLAGDALRLMEKYDEAIEMYSGLLKVRAWRGPLTPEALYWTAVCKKSQGDVERATAYFQRVYVLYSQYPEWVAKAYAGSVECLRELGREDDVIRTWREMVAIPDVAGRPEGRQAQAGLDALGGAAQ